MSINQIEVSIDQILTKYKIPYEKDKQARSFLTAFKTKEGNIPLDITPRTGGTWIDLCVPNLMQVNDRVYKGVLFQTLLTNHLEYPIVRFFYNPQTIGDKLRKRENCQG